MNCISLPGTQTVPRKSWEDVFDFIVRIYFNIVVYKLFMMWVQQKSATTSAPPHTAAWSK